MTQAKSPPHLLTLILLTAASVLTLNMFLPSLPSIAEDLGVDYATVSIAIAGYLLLTAVILLIVGPLSDRFGRRPLLLSAVAVFTVASLVCSLAENIWVFLIFRMLQGGMAAGYALSMAIVRDTMSQRQAASMIGYISMMMALAPIVGPMVGGVLDTVFGWRANFHVYTLLGISMFLLVWFDVGETRAVRSEDEADPGNPTRRLLRERRFWAYVLCTATSRGGFYIFLAGAPLVASMTFGITSAELGIYLGSITAGFMAGGFVSGRLATRTSPFALMIAGRLLACLGLLLGLAFLFLGFEAPLLFFGSTIFMGLGNGITIPSSSAAAMSVLPEAAGSSAGIEGAVTVAGGAVLTGLTGLALTGHGSPKVLLILMLAISVVGLGIIYWALRLERRSDPENV